jgi:hypothetical protein
MGRINLRAEIEKLKALPAMFDREELYGQIYDINVEANFKMALADPGDTFDEYKKKYVKEHGTKTAVVKQMLKEWQLKHQHPKY